MTYPRFCIMLLLPALLAGCQQACATPAGLFVPDTCGFIGVVTMEEELHGPLKQERGEVIAADKDYLIILVGGNNFSPFLFQRAMKLFLHRYHSDKQER